MPWARFTEDWKWPVLKTWHKRYRAGRAYNLDRETHRAAVAAGKAAKIAAPANREAAAQLLASVVMLGDSEPSAGE